MKIQILFGCKNIKNIVYNNGTDFNIHIKPNHENKNEVNLDKSGI